MTKKRVLFIYNGGTIGQVQEIRDGNTILVAPKDATRFKQAVEPILTGFQSEMDIDFEFMTAKDSTNMTPNDREQLIFRVKKAQDEEQYDAVGIAHGTDTLAYTATALALSLHGKNPSSSLLLIPVCLTGAQNPIYQRGGDGRFNLENFFRTISVAIDQEIGDVLVNFWNRVMLGCRCVKVNESHFDAFQSPAFEDAGIINGTGVHLKSELLRKKVDAKEKLEIAPKFGRGVVSFELNPGIEPRMIMGFITKGGISAMILKSLGEGNVCNEGEFNLLPVIKQATEEFMTPIFITTKFVGGNASSSHYEVGFEAIRVGGIACYNHTGVAVDV